MHASSLRPVALVLAALLCLQCAELRAEEFDVVIVGGRVMDPASGLSAQRNIGIKNGRIAAISSEPLVGSVRVDASNLVVAPGFIDLHAHGQREFEARLQAQDGVTTQLDLEGGAYFVDAWYSAREGKAPINFGASVGHVGARFLTMVDLKALGLSKESIGGQLEGEKFVLATQQKAWIEDSASDGQISAMKDHLQAGLDQGALGIGYAIHYTPGATREEIVRMFEAASDNEVTNFVHARFAAEYELGGSVDAVQELIADAAITGASVHVVHIGSSGGGRVPLLLKMIDGAQMHGIDITTEVYPYTAWSSFVGATILDGNFKEALGIDYGDIELPENGQRLTEELFQQLRRDAPGTAVVGHGMKEANVSAAIAHPGVIIASDGVNYINGRAHPRGAGTFSRVLGRYVRELGVLTLMDALGKMTYLPAKRLEASVPQMKNKGRISLGADADIVVFDPSRVIDRATFNDPALPSDGIEFVLVNGSFVVRDGAAVENTYPGKPVRRELSTN